MIATTSRFKINEKFVTSKMIDGEAIIINLANGMYYSLDKTGGVAWLLIGGGLSLDEITAAVSARFSVPARQVRDDVAALVSDLLKQNLILSADGAAATKVALEAYAGEAYETPVLNSYDDMGDVLALDPPLPQVEIEPAAWDASPR